MNCLHTVQGSYSVLIQGLALKSPLSFVIILLYSEQTNSMDLQGLWVLDLGPSFWNVGGNIFTSLFSYIFPTEELYSLTHPCR